MYTMCKKVVDNNRYPLLSLFEVMVFKSKIPNYPITAMMEHYVDNLTLHL